MAYKQTPECRKDGECHCYIIVRHYFHGTRRIITRGLTRTEAQAHCSSTEASSTTATGKAGRALTRRHGRWFDGYDHA